MDGNEDKNLEAEILHIVNEFDLADAIYGACLADSLRSDSPFYFMDPEDGATSMGFRLART